MFTTRSKKYVQGSLALRLYRKRLGEDDVRLFADEHECKAYKDCVKAVEKAGRDLMNSHRAYREVAELYPAIEEGAKKEVRIRL
jgi:hypothetical protein